MSRFKRLFIGDKSFYKTVFAIAIPVIIQHSVTNSVNLMDNIMVGQLGTEQMSGVSIANQLTFVIALCLFGGLAGPGIYGAQFYGAGDIEGLKGCFRIKIWFSFIMTAFSIAVILLFSEPLIRVFLTGAGDPAQAEAMLRYAQEYLSIMLLGFLPFALSMSYGSTLRETGETMLPMKASIVAVLTNLLGNWLLIFGNLGFPAWGVKGAAVATVLSRFVELGVLLYAVAATERFSFLHRIYRNLRVSGQLLRQVIRRGMPLLLNEAAWSLGMTSMNQLYSVRALMVVSALSVSSTIANLFNVFFLGIGNAVAVLIGHALGAGNIKKAREDIWKLIFLAFTLCAGIGLIMAVLSHEFSRLYNIAEEARTLSGAFIFVGAVIMPLHAIAHCCYFALRSGGSTIITFLYDSVFTWLIMIPITYILVHLTGLPIIPLFAISQGTNIIKVAVGILLIRTNRWQKNIVTPQASP
jgi:putative MATE family efflux protein